MKQTSIEWLIDALENPKLKWDDIKIQAKEMHKQEIIDAVSYGNKNELMASQEMFAEQYYQETFKN